jgi:hypothetical protein
MSNTVSCLLWNDEGFSLLEISILVLFYPNQHLLKEISEDKKKTQRIILPYKY